MHSYKFILLGGVGTYPCYKTKECGNLIVVLVQFKQYETASLRSSGFFVTLIHRGIKKAIDSSVLDFFPKGERQKMHMVLVTGKTV